MTTVLPRKKKDPNVKTSHHFHLEIPLPLLNRMVEEGGVEYGTANAWVLDAIERKLAQISTDKASDM